MIFKFNEPIAEKIYDNHGCLWLTKYTLNFTVDNIPWLAKFDDIWQEIEIYFDNQRVTTIEYNHRLNYENIYKVIKDEFMTNKNIQQILVKNRNKILDNIKDKYYNKLIQDYNWE